MLAVWKAIGKVLAEFVAWLLSFGAPGLFVISVLDSAFIPLPSGPDVIMIGLSSANPGMMPVYALAATGGSTIGCACLYLLARRAGEAALRRVSAKRRARIEGLLGRYDMLAVMLPAVLPPPFPFKAFVLTAGVFRFRLSRFIAAVFIGRAIRFLIEGWLAITYGNEALSLIKENSLTVLAVVGGLVAIFLIIKIAQRARRSSDSANKELPVSDEISAPPATGA